MINSIIFYTKLLFIQADDIEQVSFQLLLLHVFAHSHTEMEYRIMFQKDAYLSSNVDVLKQDIDEYYDDLMRRYQD